MLTVVIPSKTERFLQRTIQDVLEKATGDIEILPIVDGYYPPKEEIVTDPRVRYIHLPAQPYSQKRHGINLAISQAKGEYVMSLDAHCMMAKGFDTQLAKDHQPNWVQIPRRNRLDAENWSLQPQSDNRPPIDYEYIMFPPLANDHAIHGFKWDERTLSNWNVRIDNTIQFQGSCWFMTKKWFQQMGFMQVEGYTGWGQEAEEISLTTWQHGGRVITNKNTWYAHLHKGPVYGRMYHLSRDENRRSYAYSYNKWLVENKVFFISLVEKFPLMPGWPSDWKKRLWPENTTTIISNTINDMPKTSNQPTKSATLFKAPERNKDLTVIYLTSNTEKPDFEKKIIASLKENSKDLPLVSVSVKPLKLGKNITLNTKTPVSPATTLKMLLLGLSESKTTYAVIANDDCLYPPEYFTFTPPSDDHLYQYANVWALGGKYWQKAPYDGAQMANRKYWIESIKTVLKNYKDEPGAILLTMSASIDKTTWTSENPVVNCKSTDGARRFPTVLRNVLPRRMLAYWGMAQDLITKLYS